MRPRCCSSRCSHTRDGPARVNEGEGLVELDIGRVGVTGSQDDEPVRVAGSIQEAGEVMVAGRNLLSLVWILFVVDFVVGQVAAGVVAAVIASTENNGVRDGDRREGHEDEAQEDDDDIARDAGCFFIFHSESISQRCFSRKRRM